MIFTTALTVCLLSVFATAQYGGYGGGATTTTAASATAASSPAAAPSAPPDTSGHINIDVAFQKTLTFHPSNITAPNGTIVTFWYPNNGVDHSVTQSSFSLPCTYLVASSNSSAGFDSGLQSGKQFSITIVDDTKPIWFHCKQAGHCGLGMVGSINAPPTGNTFQAFQRAAMQIGSSEAKETDNGPVTGGVNGIATAAPAATAASASASTKSSSASAILISGATLAFSVALLAAVLT